MKPIFYAYLVTVLVVSGCSSGKSTFERGNYYEAVITSVNRLRKNNDHKKSVETLRQAYPMAVAFYEDRAKTSLASAERFKWSEVVKSYTYINTMYDEIKRCPGALAVVPNPVNYFSKLQEARQNAAEEHYAAGILALQGSTRESAKQAYGYFKTTNEYVTGYKEVNDYMAAALAAATVKIVVEPIPVHSKSVGVSAEFFNDKISEFVHTAPISEFVKFYTRAEAQKIKLNPDHIIQLQFDDFTVGQVYKHEKEIQLTKDSVVMGTYVTPATASTHNQTNTNLNPSAKDGFVVNGTAVVASTGTPVNTTTSNTAQNTAAENERAAKELAERRLREQQAAETALAEKLKAEREAAERERLAKEAERERAAKEAAEKERIAREAAEKALADKTVAEREAADRERAEKERLERERLEKELAEKMNAEKERAAKELAEKERLAAEAAAKAQAEKERIEKERAEKARVEKEAAEREKVSKEKAEKEKADKEKAEKEMAEKEKAEKEKADKEKAEKEKADREKADKEKIAKEKIIDPSINAADTLNVTDPVYICHIPPGNKMNARSLRINRAALKAHLAHGDTEGSCADQKNENGKGADEPKGKPADSEQTKPQNGKAKGPGGSASVGDDARGLSPLRFTDPVLFASADNDGANILDYLAQSFVQSDTNKVYGTVKATLYHYTKTTTSKGIVSFRIIDAKTGALLSAEKMPGEFVWKSEWATFNGDERALSADQMKLSKQKELPAPAPQELFIEFTRPIYDQITSKLREFYKGY